MAMKLHAVSFGCQMNVADSEEMGRALTDRGFEHTANQEEADAILINTCTVRAHAEDKAFSFVGRLREWKKTNPERLLIVAGCAAERTKDSLQKRFPFIDLVVGAKSIEQFPAIIEEALKEKYNWGRENNGFWPADDVIASEAKQSHESFNEIAAAPSGPRDHGGASAYVTIMRGCNYSCSYCIVPSVRGREIYRPAETILKEVAHHAKNDAREIMLLGQTVNSYNNKGLGPRAEGLIKDFADLLKAIAQVDGVERIRFMSPHPYYFSDKLIETLAQTPQVCEHIHLPAQSGSNRILSLMRRNYTRERYLEIVAKLRAAIPEVSITTDFIVGFPTETEEDFQETLSLAQEADFNGAYCFKFSARQGTEAAVMEGDPPKAVKEERLAKLLELTEKIGREKTKAYAGKIVKVLWTNPREGTTPQNYIVKIPAGQEAQAGSISPAQIETTKNRTLLGKLLPDGQRKKTISAGSRSG